MIEYRIRRGDGACEYSGNKSPVLIQLVDAEGTPSGWMGMDALSEALSLLNALNGMAPQLALATPDSPVPQSAAVAPVAVQPQTPRAPHVPRQPQAKGKMSVRDEVALESFVSACQELCENPPADRNGNAQGVPGYAVRELVDKWRGRFQGGDELMVPTLKNTFGVPDGQIDFLMGKAG
jgi:hypothetical protein